MTSRRSMRTWAERESRHSQFRPGHVGGRVDSAQPVMRRSGTVRGFLVSESGAPPVILDPCRDAIIGDYVGTSTGGYDDDGLWISQRWTFPDLTVPFGTTCKRIWFTGTVGPSYDIVEGTLWLVSPAQDYGLDDFADNEWGWRGPFSVSAGDPITFGDTYYGGGGWTPGTNPGSVTDASWEVLVGTNTGYDPWRVLDDLTMHIEDFPA